MSCSNIVASDVVVVTNLSIVSVIWVEWFSIIVANAACVGCIMSLLLLTSEWAHRNVLFKVLDADPLPLDQLFK